MLNRADETNNSPPRDNTSYYTDNANPNPFRRVYALHLPPGPKCGTTPGARGFCEQFDFTPSVPLASMLHLLIVFSSIGNQAPRHTAP